MSWITELLTGGATKSIEAVATEWIDTAKEEAEAKTLMIKALDPNGKLRRDLTRFTCIVYAFYLAITTILTIMVSFGLGDHEGAKLASDMLKELALPITTAWGAITSASFGVNYANTKNGK